MIEREQRDMNVGEWEEGNNTFLHMVVDTYLHHKWVMGGRKGLYVSENQSTHLLHGTSQVCPIQKVWVWVHQEKLCTSSLIEHI
jgi:hypothetical protein